jgi:hypothetical protein
MGGAMSLSSHQSVIGKNDEWLTPPEILQPLGAFDLDPCAPVVRPWDTARKHFTVDDNGLALPWEGRVWLNPPFNRFHVSKWIEKMADHGNGIALIAARTETVMFFRLVWERAQAVLFIKGRPHFHYVTGERAPFNSGAPMCLVAYGFSNVRWLSIGRVPGQFVRLRDPVSPCQGKAQDNATTK